MTEDLEAAKMPPLAPGSKEQQQQQQQQQQDEKGSSSSLSSQYYAKGSVELAVETPVMMKRLEKRRVLTGNSERLLIILCGLPARGKSFVARKLLNYFTWRGNKCKIFNVGMYRRQATTELMMNDENDQGGIQQNASFFDDSNQLAAQIREKAAQVALKETLEWLEDNNNNGKNGGEAGESCGSLCEKSDDNQYYYGHTSHSSRRQTQRIAIFDATNSTKARRNYILQQCDHACEVSGKETGVVFVESICDDEELLQENFQVKISTCPDFEGMAKEEALKDLQERVNKYEARYEPLEANPHTSYIKIFNLSSRLEVNHVYGRLAKVVVPALMSFNTGSQPIFLCRAGETKAMRRYIQEQQQQQQQEQQESPAAVDGSAADATTGPPLSRINSIFPLIVENGQLVTARKRQRGDRLGEGGLRFRDALCDFVEKEGMEFIKNKSKTLYHNHHPSKNDTGTSISGLRSQNVPHSFPCLVMSSTMPRALETASWDRLPFPIKDVSNLNPLDMGDFSGLDLESIKQQHPAWYKHLKREPFHTRFPGGESYSDLINRLESVVIDMEQQLGPTVVVSHVSVLQVLLSYFRSTPVAECMSVEIPMHTVLKFVPLRGGGWLESHHELVPELAAELPPTLSQDGEEKPIWGDSSSCLPTKLSSGNLAGVVDNYEPPEEAPSSPSNNSRVSGVFFDE